MKHKLFTTGRIYTKWLPEAHMSTLLPTLLLSLEHRLVATDAARLAPGMSAIVIGALSILCWAVLVAIAFGLWELL
jgi:hypothetical protein